MFVSFFTEFLILFLSFHFLPRIIIYNTSCFCFIFYSWIVCYFYYSVVLIKYTTYKTHECGTYLVASTSRINEISTMLCIIYSIRHGIKIMWENGTELENVFKRDYFDYNQSFVYYTLLTFRVNRKTSTMQRNNFIFMFLIRVANFSVQL